MFLLFVCVFLKIIKLTAVQTSSMVLFRSSIEKLLGCFCFFIRLWSKIHYDHAGDESKCMRSVVRNIQAMIGNTRYGKKKEVVVEEENRRSMEESNSECGWVMKHEGLCLRRNTWCWVWRNTEMHVNASLCDVVTSNQTNSWLGSSFWGSVCDTYMFFTAFFPS